MDEGRADGKVFCGRIHLRSVVGSGLIYSEFKYKIARSYLDLSRDI